jgi:peptidyl-tRNA hydrolase, PTH1 family
MPETSPQGIRMVVGLGNPGREYEGTRHNVGFDVVDRVGASIGAAFAKEPRWDAFIARAPGGDLVLLKPTTFMNLSGESAGEYARFFRIQPSSVLVVADDVALPLGALRIRAEGGSGGQKGLGSILVHFATEKVPRLRVGVGGAAPGADLSGHVLSRFRPEERAEADLALDRAAEAVLHAVREGLPSAMNLYNAAPAPKQETDTHP